MARSSAIEEYELLVSSAPSLGLRVLPPLTFPRPVTLTRRVAIARPPPPPRPRRALGVLAAVLVSTGLALAGWNFYWLLEAGWARDAIAAIFG
jgi:hypothetical protein